MKIVDLAIAVKYENKKLKAENERLKNENANTGEDLSYHKAVLDGSWPSAIEILTKALENAKKKKSNT